MRILERIDRLTHGNPGDSKPLGAGLFELRLNQGPGYRVYYVDAGARLILLLCAGTKSTQQKDITKARQLAGDWHNDRNEDD